MFDRFGILPEEYPNSYLFKFFIPLFSAFLLIIWFDFLNLYTLLILGAGFIIGEFYFAKKITTSKVGIVVEDITYLLSIAFYLAIHLHYR